MLNTTQRTMPRMHLLACATLVLPALLLAGPGTATAQSQASEKLPDAAKILDKYVEVTGGKAAYDKLKNRVSKATFEMPAQGVKADLVVYAARPNKIYTLLESDMLGKIEKGCDGEVAWELSTMGGPQIKEGEEKAFQIREATFDGTTQWRKLYPKVECVSVETIDEKPCYKVVLTPAEGAPVIRYYDQQSGLLTKVEMSLTTAMGTIPLESYITEYKKVDDVLLPHKVRVVAMGTERLLTTKSVEHNVEMPADRFKLPEDVQELLDMEDAKPEKP